MTADLAFEYALRAQGHEHIAGLDEAGRGAWAGPVMAAAVVLPLDRFDLASALEGVDDSKALTPALREDLLERICRVAVAVGVGSAGPDEIDAIGIVPATRLAMRCALESLSENSRTGGLSPLSGARPVRPTHLLIDYLPLPESGLPCTALVKGDARSLSIAAASIVAKVSRDRLMRALDEMYPHYGFGAHKGYGTVLHRRALERLGPSPIHRRSFRPVAECVRGVQPPSQLGMC